MPIRKHILICLAIILYFVIESASDENPKLQRYLPMSEDDLSNTNQRFRQIMQGQGVLPTGANWVPSTLKTKKLDVQDELAKLNSTYVYQPDWPKSDRQLGSVTAVSLDKAGNVVVFHRADRLWDADTFTRDNVFKHTDLEPISASTVIAYDRQTGNIVYEWGKGLFYMPHGLNVDADDNVWVTDVALHQVMKFGPNGSGDKPLMTLGTKFIPGQGDKFCKPTSVAVLPNGDFFVADGYCNARILKYNKAGKKILTWGHNSFSGDAYNMAPKNFFAIPHALTLIPENDLLCTADRENGRIQCFFSSNGTFHSQYYSPLVGDRLFSMDYAPVNGGQFFIVNGPTAELGIHPEHYNEVHGFVMDQQTKQVLSKFGPNGMEFANPHDIAVTSDGNEIYVAELKPLRIHKFLHNKIAKTISISAVKPTVTAIEANGLTATAKPSHKSGGQPFALLILGLLVSIFGTITIGIVIWISKRSKRGCLPFGGRNRRHAWDFPAKSDGFKLGNLLDRKRGFEKLDQNASDEEPDASTSMLASAHLA